MKFGINLRRIPSPRFLSGTVNAPVGLPEVFPFGWVQPKLSRTAALRIESVAVASRTVADRLPARAVRL